MNESQHFSLYANFLLEAGIVFIGRSTGKAGFAATPLWRSDMTHFTVMWENGENRYIYIFNTH